MFFCSVNDLVISLLNVNDEWLLTLIYIDPSGKVIGEVVDDLDQILMAKLTKDYINRFDL